jgi:hypothetical protein
MGYLILAGLVYLGMVLQREGILTCEMVHGTIRELSHLLRSKESKNDSNNIIGKL